MFIFASKVALGAFKKYGLILYLLSTLYLVHNVNQTLLCYIFFNDQILYVINTTGIMTNSRPAVCVGVSVDSDSSI